MTNKSKLFDGIRVKSRRGKTAKEQKPPCEWDGCEEPGTHKAPKIKGGSGAFHNFCLKHVREYNKSFNYFADMKDDEIATTMRKSAQTGERPTWGMGINARSTSTPKAKVRAKRSRDFADGSVHDPHNLFARLARNRGATTGKKAEKRLAETDRRALEVMGLKGHKSSEEIKAAYKSLVKMHHPDANGGDRGSEDRLRAIITAYTHLKQKGFV